MFRTDFLSRSANDLADLPFLLRCSMSFASFSVTPAGATTKSSLFVIAWIKKIKVHIFIHASNNWSLCWIIIHLSHMNVSATLPPPPEVCHGPSQTESLCLWTSLCPPACCPFCPFLSRGSQRSRDVSLLRTHHRPCAADSSPLGPWWSPARISGEGKKLWLRSKAFAA